MLGVDESRIQVLANGVIHKQHHAVSRLARQQRAVSGARTLRLGAAGCRALEDFFSTFLSEESSKPRKSEWQLPSPGVLQEAATAPAIRLKRRLLLGTFVRVTRSPSRPPARRLCTDPASVCTQISCLTRTLRSRSSHARTHPPTHTHHPRMHSRLPHYLSH